MKFNKLIFSLTLIIGLSGFSALNSESEVQALSSINIQNLSRDKLIVIGLVGIGLYFGFRTFFKSNKSSGFTRSGKTQEATHCHCGPGFSFVPVTDNSVDHGGCNRIPVYCQHGVAADLIGKYSRGRNYCCECDRLIRYTDQERDRIKVIINRELANKRSMYKKHASKC